MLGWLVIVRRPGARTGHANQDPLVLARWEAGISGLDWIKEIERAGDATRVTEGGYPTEFTVAAHAVMPMLQAGTPPAGPRRSIPVIGDDYVMSSGWTGQMTVYRERLVDVPADQLLVVEAWDMS